MMTLRKHQHFLYFGMVIMLPVFPGAELRSQLSTNQAEVSGQHADFSDAVAIPGRDGVLSIMNKVADWQTENLPEPKPRPGST